MIKIQRHALGALIGPCQGPYGTRRTFSVEGVRLIVPDAVQEKYLRWLADFEEKDFLQIYQGVYGMNVEYAEIMPPKGLWQCCLNVLRTKTYDPATGKTQRSGWGHTCSGYFACFENYVKTLREQGESKRGRMKLAEGLYSPSLAEAICIKDRFYRHHDIQRAYSECGASDIFPTFVDAKERIAAALDQATGMPLYEILKTLNAMSPTEPDPIPVIHIPHPAPPSKAPTWLPCAGGALIALLLLKRR